MEIDRDFTILEQFADHIQDPDLAQALRYYHSQTMQLLDQADITTIKLTNFQNFKKELGSQQRLRKDTHLALVAQEALRAEDGEFIHDSGVSVAQSLKAKADNDKRIIPYQIPTLTHHIGDSAKPLLFGVRILTRRHSLDFRLADLADPQNVTKAFHGSTAWQETVTDFARTFPGDTMVLEIEELLTFYSKYSSIPTVNFRLAEARDHISRETQQRSRYY